MATAADLLREADDADRLARALGAFRGYAWELDLAAGDWWTSDTRALAGGPREAFGRTRDDVERMVHPDDLPRVRRTLRDLLKGDTDTAECEYRLRGLDTRWIWVLDRALVTARAADGRALRVTGLRADATDRKREEARQLAAQRAGRTGLFEIDPETGRATGTPAFFENYGLPGDRGEWSGEEWLAAVHPDDRERVAGHVRDLFRERRVESVVEYRIRRADGATRWTRSRTRVEFDDRGRARRAYGVQQDITEQKLAELALARSEAELSTIHAQALVGICHRTPDGVLLSANQRYAEILGRRPDEIEGGNWRDLAHPDDVGLVEAMFAAQLASGAPLVLEHRCLRPDGSVVWCRSQISQVPDVAGGLRSVVIVLEDVTEQKRAQAEERDLHARLERAGRMFTAGAMGATLAHELQQPHASIANYLAAAKRILERDGADALAIEAIEGARAEAMRAGEIVRRMRNFVALGQPAARPEDLGAIVEELLGLAPFGPSVRGRIRVEIAPGARRVFVDRVQIQQVLTNLLKNALEAADGPVALAAAPDGDLVRVTVADGGPGLPAELAGRAFELFATTKPGGLGLGLAIARNIVEAHGGRIWFEGGAGGHRACFTLPT